MPLTLDVGDEAGQALARPQVGHPCGKDLQVAEQEELQFLARLLVQQLDKEFDLAIEKKKTS